MRHEDGQLELLGPDAPHRRNESVRQVFSPARLTQARLLAGLTKNELALAVGVSAAAVGQFESGTVTPKAGHLPALAAAVNLPVAFFGAGRPAVRIDPSMAHFHSLRSTRVSQRARATTFVELIWELVNALERRIALPPVRLPDHDPTTDPEWADPTGAARAVRQTWQLSTGPLSHLVRKMEQAGIVVTHLPFAEDDEIRRIDAFSTSHTARPVVVLTPDRNHNVYEHRFSAAHELGHVVLHHDHASGELRREREADLFAAELLAPADSIRNTLGSRIHLGHLAEIGNRWGVSIKFLIQRSREIGLISDVSARRAYQKLAIAGPALQDDPVDMHPGEQPQLLAQAYLLAEQHGLQLRDLETELAMPLTRIRTLLNLPDQKPTLRLI